MTNKNKSEYKRNYAMAKHHAWAGSVLLAILGAIRWFTDNTEWYQKDIIFILAGVLIIIYILIALVFTYQFRSGLATEENNGRQIRSNQNDQTMANSINLSPKELEKIEKKKGKAESKRLKKLAKSQQKKEKESSYKNRETKKKDYKS